MWSWVSTNRLEIFSIARRINRRHSAAVTTPPLTTYTSKLLPVQAKELHAYLRGCGGQFEFEEVPYTTFAAKTREFNLRMYESGKLVVQGKGTQEFVEFVLEPLILKEAKLGYEEVLNPEMFVPRLGIDESGKGDFFGPLCIAGVYVNESVVKAWKGAGVQDSKNIGSDRRIAELAKVIESTPGCVTSVVPIGNEAYNKLYKTMRSVNAILAWGHARVIENLMLKKHQMNPVPIRAISDQFAQDKKTVSKALMSLGREIELVQRHKAESDLAVAAASILARNAFVTRLDRLGKECGVLLPKGASAAVEKAGVAFIEKHGAQSLNKVAKMHFRTSYKIQGLPEPPKKEWVRPKKASSDEG